MAQNSNFTGKKKTQVKNSFGDLDMIDPNKKKPKEEEQKPKKESDKKGK